MDTSIMAIIVGGAERMAKMQNVLEPGMDKVIVRELGFDSKSEFEQWKKKAWYREEMDLFPALTEREAGVSAGRWY